MAMEREVQKRKEIYTYSAPWLIYGMNWSVRADQRFRLAIGSFEEEYNNSVRIVQLDEESHQFVDCGGFEHPYPTTKIMWNPDQSGGSRDLLATTGDYLRLWNVMDNKSVRLEALLNNVRAGPSRTQREGASVRAVSPPPGACRSACAGAVNGRRQEECGGGQLFPRSRFSAAPISSRSASPGCHRRRALTRPALTHRPALTRCAEQEYGVLRTAHVLRLE